HDHAEVFELRVYVESKSVAGNPARDPYANGCDLFVSNPYTGQAGNPGAFDPKIPEGADQYLFDSAHVAVHITPATLQYDYGVADHPARIGVSAIDAAASLMALY